MESIKYVTEGVHRDTIQEYLIVEVRASAAAAVTDLGYCLTPLDILTLFNPESMEVPISGFEVVAMVDGEHLSVITLFARKHYQSICWSNDRCSDPSRYVESFVELPLVSKGRDPVPKSGGKPPVSWSYGGRAG